MGNRTSLLEAEIGKLKMEGDPEQLIVARQWVCKDVSALSDRFDDSIWTLPGWCQFTPSSSWVTYLGLAQYEIARGHLPRTYFAVVKSYDDFLICEFPEVRLSSNRSKFSRSCASEVSFS
ncbi:hypothetical protein BHE74_00019721 [Ensete ventricosum]|nr:hypothetical protein BHE74_00019721 [Ensete ventricosum]